MSKARHLRLETVDFLHHHTPTFRLCVRQVVRIRRVNPSVDTLRSAPGEKRLTGMDGPKEVRTSILLRRFDIDAGHAKPEPGMHLLRLELLTGEDEDITVTRGVDHGCTGDRVTASLRGKDNVRDSVAIHYYVRGPSMVEKPNAGFGHPSIATNLNSSGSYATE